MEDINASLTTKHYKIKIKESGAELATSTSFQQKPLILQVKRLDTAQIFVSDPFEIQSYIQTSQHPIQNNLLFDQTTSPSSPSNDYPNIDFLHSFIDDVLRNEHNFKQMSNDEILCGFRMNRDDPKSFVQVSLKKSEKGAKPSKAESSFDNFLVEDLIQENKKLNEDLSKIHEIFDPLYTFDVHKCGKDLMITAESLKCLISDRRRWHNPYYCSVLTKINNSLHYQTCALTKKPFKDCDDMSKNSFTIKALTTKNSYIMIGMVPTEFEFFNPASSFYEDYVFSQQDGKKGVLEVEHEAEDLQIERTKQKIKEKAIMGEDPVEGTLVQEELEDPVPGYKLYSNKKFHPSYSFGLSGCRLYSGGIAEDWGEMICEGDTVTFFYDSKKGNIEIFKNDKSLGVLFTKNEIDMTKDYLFVVSLSDVEDKVAIVG